MRDPFSYVRKCEPFAQEAYPQVPRFLRRMAAVPSHFFPPVKSSRR